jgi:hypothetical protein
MLVYVKLKILELLIVVCRLVLLKVFFSRIAILSKLANWKFWGPPLKTEEGEFRPRFSKLSMRLNCFYLSNIVVISYVMYNSLICITFTYLQTFKNVFPFYFIDYISSFYLFLSFSMLFYFRATASWVTLVLSSPLETRSASSGQSPPSKLKFASI